MLSSFSFDPIIMPFRTNPTVKPKRSRLRRAFGFTLIELLVVLTVMVTLGGMLTLALSSAVREAKSKRTQADVLTIGQLLQTRMNEISLSKVELIYGASGEEIYTAAGSGAQSAGGLGFGGTVSIGAFNAAERSRLVLSARRDLARMVMPECQADLLYPPASLQFRTLVTSSTGYPNIAQVRPPAAWIRMRKEAGLLSPGAVDQRYGPSNPCNDPTVDSISASSDATFEAILRLSTKAPESFDPATQSLPIATTWTREFESAECLYLILASTELFGQRAIDRIAKTQIKDIDGDLFPEIVDAWGNPYVFIRNPIGVRNPTVKNYDVTETDLTRAFPSDPDPFDFLLADFRFDRTAHPTAAPADSVFSQATPAVTPSPEAYEPIYLPPAVISAGVDGEFGIFHSYEDLDDDGAGDIGCSRAYSSSATQLTPAQFSPRYPTNIFNPGSSFVTVRYPDPFQAIAYDSVNTTTAPTFSIGNMIYAKSYRSLSGNAQVEVAGGFGHELKFLSLGGNQVDLSDFAADNITSLDSDF